MPAFESNLSVFFARFHSVSTRQADLFRSALVTISSRPVLLWVQCIDSPDSET